MKTCTQPRHILVSFSTTRPSAALRSIYIPLFSWTGSVEIECPTLVAKARAGRVTTLVILFVDNRKLTLDCICPKFRFSLTTQRVHTWKI
jgi:hypothetical protein